MAGRRTPHLDIIRHLLHDLHQTNFPDDENVSALEMLEKTAEDMQGQRERALTLARVEWLSPGQAEDA